MEKNLDAIKLFEEHYFQMHNRYPVTFVKGRGCYLYDDQGNEYIDALAGIAVNSLGHSHPAMVDAIQKQAAELIHISNFYYNQPQSQLAQKITSIAGYDRAFFCNSGLEANEGAVKLVRKYAHERGRNGKIFYFSGCFHGRSLGTVTMGKKIYQEGFEPLPGGFEMLPYNEESSLGKISEDDVAVFIEFVQGEGGVNPANQEFIDKLFEVCREKGVLIVADEIQTGIGRTGKWFGYENYHKRPDVITLAKGLAGGFPIGAVLADDEIAKTFQPGNHSSTFGGNPLACATSLATLETIEKEGLVDHSAKTGKYLLSQLGEKLKGIQGVKEIRGKGLLIGIEFDFPCKDLASQLLQNKVLVSCTAGNVIRIAPPLIIDTDVADKLIATLLKSLEELAVNANY